MPKTRKRKACWSKMTDALGTTVRIFERPGGATVYYSYRHPETGRKVQASTGYSDRIKAELHAVAKVEETVRDRIVGRTESPTLGDVFRLWALKKAPGLKPRWRKAGETRRDLFTRAWGAGMLVSDIGQHEIDSFCQARRAGVLTPFTPEDVEGRKGRRPKLVHDGALDADLRWLSATFNFAHGVRSTGAGSLSRTRLRI